ncbi:hypothetical protein VTN00DRAFT_9577 [Thermoascus crustaceus]|uniref:uncharacterized protein n=1 Tax=Thermoascus crustaceus TaxID=5088 RepID=UPI003742CC25
MTTQRPESFQIISSLRFDPELPGAIAQYVADGYPDPKDSPYYLLLYHRDRLLNAAIHFNWPEAITFLEKDLSQFSQTLDASIPDRTKPWRLRVALDANGTCSVDVHPTAPLCSPLVLLVPSSTAPEDGTTPQPAAPWRLYIDSQPTTPSAFTTHKTTARDEYTAARQRAGITSPQEPAEVLVVNGKGEIMEGSITTPYFRRRRRRSAAGSAVDEETKTPVWVTPPLSSGGNAGTTRRYALERGFCVEQVVRAEELVDGEQCWLSNGVRGFMRAVIVLRK